MKNSLRPIIVPGFLGITISITIGIILWVLSHIFYANEAMVESPWFFAFSSNLIIFREFLSLALTILIGFSLTSLIEKYSIIRTRTLLPTFFFILHTGVNPILHFSEEGLLGALLLVMALGQFLPMYQDKKAVRHAFNVMFILMGGSFFVTELLFFIPIFLIGFSVYQAISFRTISATLIGIVTPLIIVFSSFYLWSDIQIPIQYLIKDWNSLSFYPMDISRFIYFTVLATIFLISLVQFIIDSHKEKIRTRRTIQFFIFAFFASTLIFLLRGELWIKMAPIVSIFLVTIISHFFSLKKGKFSFIVFWILLFSSFSYFTYILFF